MERTPIAAKLHRTRAQTKMDPTREEKLSQAFEARKLVWREDDKIAEDQLTVGQKFKRSFLRTVDFRNDEVREDRARLLVSLLWIFKLHKYVPVEQEAGLLEHLLTELEHHVSRFAGPSRRGPKLEEVDEEELREFFQARRAQVCADLEDLNRQYKAALKDSGTWDDTVLTYRALTKQLVKLFLDQVLILRFLSGEALGIELASWTAFIKENVHRIMAMFLTAIKDKDVELPFLFTDIELTRGSIRTQEGEEEEEESPIEMAGVEGAAAEGAAMRLSLGQELLDPYPALPSLEVPIVPQPGTLATRGMPLTVHNKDIPRKPLISTPKEAKPLQKTSVANRPKEMSREQKNAIDVVWGLGNISLETKSAIVQSLMQDCAPKADALSELTGKYGFSTDETSAAAYGDAAALAHYNSLPNVQLPPFYGNSLEFPKWWQMFTYLVDKNPKIPQIMKLHLLQKSLKGTAEYLTHQVTFSPHSYETLKNNVCDAFDDADAALRQLAERIKSWPTLKKNDYKQLAEFTGFATNYVMQLMYFEEGAAFNPKNVINELYGKFNPQMMGDYRREWAQVLYLKGTQTDREQVVWLLDWLKEQLKIARAYYHADPNRTPIQLGMPTGIAMEFKSNQQKGKAKNSNASTGGDSNGKKTSPTTAETLYTTTDPALDYENAFATNVGRGRGRGGNRGGQRGRGRGHPGASVCGRGRRRGTNSATTNGNNGPQSAVINSNTNNVAKSNSNGNGQKNPTDKSDSGYDITPCLFCGQQQHPARSCTQNMKPDTVYLKAVEALLCLNCLRYGHYASACPHPTCSVDGCQSRHHKSMHGHGNQPSKKP